ncbi:hypothetical protein [Streptomyces scabiei]|uniref:hypothetical protein n=1 Tax=Streptomyces scabiei TaxID=1930 RepID=UPI0029A9190F|nr:hypothetical protein [Streptomyces scabiei]MDX3524837.1 hypothetical protein [Streptomyces scabiei]
MELAELLVGDREIFRLCRSALTGGADFKVWIEPTSTREIESIYSRRMRTLNRTGQPSIGVAEAVADLKVCAEAELLIGYVDDRPTGGYYFQIFLMPSFEKVIACLGVRPSVVDSDPVDSE